MRTIVRGIIHGETIPLKEIGLEDKNIKSIYTILDEEGMYYKFDPITGKPIEKSLDNLFLRHWYTVFVEDKIHDWNINGDNFRYYAASGNKGDKFDLLVEYE